MEGIQAQAPRSGGAKTPLGTFYASHRFLFRTRVLYQGRRMSDVLFNVNGDASTHNIVNCVREGVQMTHLTGKPLIKFQVMVGLVLQHNSPSGQPQYSYFEPSMNTAFSRGRLFVYSSSGVKQLQK